MSHTADEVREFLHQNFPLARAMRVEVGGVDASGVRLLAPLEANLNHQGTAFGGSISALALLSAWTVVHLGLRDEGLACRTVIQRNSVEYLRPVKQDFEVLCALPGGEEWARFAGTLRRRGRGRLLLHAQALARRELVGTFQGAFVATTCEPGEAGPA